MTLIELLEARGRTVLDEVMVVGFDDRHAARRFRPAFPTTDPDFERMGEIGCEMLLNVISSGELRIERRVLALPLLTERRHALHGNGYPAARKPRALTGV
jgi:DNA-binding LacI/PurR family transcriptional regulator